MISCSTKPAPGRLQKTRSTWSRIGCSVSACSFASPLVSSWMKPLPWSCTPTTRWVTRVPSDQTALTMSPARMSAASVRCARPSEPVGMSGDMRSRPEDQRRHPEPDRGDGGQDARRNRARPPPRARSRAATRVAPCTAVPPDPVLVLRGGEQEARHRGLRLQRGCRPARQCHAEADRLVGAAGRACAR